MALNHLQVVNDFRFGVAVDSSEFDRRSINSNRLAVFTDEVNVVSRGTPTVGIE